jgi:bacillithiol system protein YtxJ
MNWISLESEDQLQQIKIFSQNKPQVIFKHSTRCVISSMALNRIKFDTIFSNADFYLLDLLKHRNLSSSIANDYEVQHASPQILIIKNAECIYDESHSGINMDELIEFISSLN